MSPTPMSNRITVDFRAEVRPSRSWILGVDDPASSRIDLHAFSNRTGPAPMPAVNPALFGGECTCPEYCELDHANG